MPMRWFEASRMGCDHDASGDFTRSDIDHSAIRDARIGWQMGLSCSFRDAILVKSMCFVWTLFGGILRWMLLYSQYRVC